MLDDQREENMTCRQTKVLHVEVGGAYGGSLRALELYLAHSDQGRFLHDLLLYYPTPRVERLKLLARNISIFNESWTNKVFRTRGDTRDWLKSYLKDFPFTTAFNDMRASARLVSCLPIVNRLSRILHAGSYDVIHINNTITYQAPTVLAAKKVGVRAIAHIRSEVRNNSHTRYLLRRVGSVVTINHTLERELRSWSIPVNIRTCYDAVSPPSINVSVSDTLRASLAPSGAILIGSVGRLEEEKDFQSLIHAAARVIRIRPNVYFAIAGEGSLRSSLQSLIARFKLTDHFHLCGFREDVANFLSALDLFVSSSLWEGGPLALIEAVLLDKPVVATRVGICSEAVVPGENGETVPPSDPQALASAILLALERAENNRYQSTSVRRRLEALTDPSYGARLLDETLDQVASVRCDQVLAAYS
jgi:glycosyltransferase involved in cell wall biosynthesis